MENIELNLTDILDVFAKRWPIILLSVILCAAIGLSYSLFAVVPMYGLNVTFMVNPEFGNAQSTTIVTETQSYTYAKDAIKTYMRLLSNNEFFDMLYENVDGKCVNNYSVGQLKGMVSFSNIDETELFNATIKSTSREDAYTIALEMQKLAPQRIQELRGFEVLKVVDRPQLKNISVVNNNSTRNTVVGGIIGALLSALFFVILKLTDVRINDESDIKKAYNIPVLGVIPDFQAVGTDKSGKPIYGGKIGENKR